MTSDFNVVTTLKHDVIFQLYHNVHKMEFLFLPFSLHAKETNIVVHDTLQLPAWWSPQPRGLGPAEHRCSTGAIIKTLKLYCNIIIGCTVTHYDHNLKTTVIHNHLPHLPEWDPDSMWAGLAPHRFLFVQSSPYLSCHIYRVEVIRLFIGFDADVVLRVHCIYLSFIW